MANLTGNLISELARFGMTTMAVFSKHRQLIGMVVLRMRIGFRMLDVGCSRPCSLLGPEPLYPRLAPHSHIYYVHAYEGLVLDRHR